MTCSVPSTSRRRVRLPERATSLPSVRAWPRERTRSAASAAATGRASTGGTTTQPGAPATTGHDRPGEHQQHRDERARPAASYGLGTVRHQRPDDGVGGAQDLRGDPGHDGVRRGRDEQRAAALVAVDAGHDRAQTAPAGEPQPDRLAQRQAGEPAVVDGRLPRGDQAAREVPRTVRRGAG